MHTPVQGPYIFATGALELMTARLVDKVFGAPLTRGFVAMQQQPRPRRPGQRPWDPPFWSPWSCASEDGLVGYTVYRVAMAERLRLDFISLAGLLIDVTERTTPAELRRLVTAHKLEIDESRLRADANAEASANAVRAKQKSGYRVQETFRKQRLEWMARLRPQLDALNASTRAPQRSFRCYSQQNATTTERACVNSRGDAVRCGRRANGARGGSAAPPHPSISTMLERFPQCRTWRYCMVVEPTRDNRCASWDCT